MMTQYPFSLFFPKDAEIIFMIATIGSNISTYSIRD